MNSSSDGELITPKTAHCSLRQLLLSPKLSSSNFKLMVPVLSIESMRYIFEERDSVAPVWLTLDFITNLYVIEVISL